jgi:hypothetical protein
MPGWPAVTKNSSEKFAPISLDGPIRYEGSSRGSTRMQARSVPARLGDPES